MNRKFKIIASISFILILFVLQLFKNKIKSLISLLIYISKLLNNSYIIDINLNGIQGNFGPGSLLKGINHVLPFISQKCIFITKTMINYLNPDFYYVPGPILERNDFVNLEKNKLINKYILGPNFVPNRWYNFPNVSIWKEKHFSEILDSIKGVVVHSNRVRDHIANYSKSLDKIKKYIIMRPCTNIKPEVITKFEKRKIDIIFFEKYSDLNRTQQGKDLLSILEATGKKIVKMKYKNYDRKTMKYNANNSKFIIYFSFFDTGAIGLKEIQNYGVFAFTHQKDLVIHNDTSFYIPELASIDKIKLAVEKILTIIENISKSNPNSELIAKKNQLINNCKNSLKDLCYNL